MKRKKTELDIDKEALINYLAHTEGLTSNKARQIVNSIIYFITIHLCDFKRVELAGLGYFEPNLTKFKRDCYIPALDIRKPIPPKLRVKFSTNETLSNLLLERTDKYIKLYGIEDE